MGTVISRTAEDHVKHCPCQQQRQSAPSQGDLRVWQQRTTRSTVPASNKDSQHHLKAISVCDSRGPREALSLPTTKTVNTITRQSQCVTAEDHVKHCPCQQQRQSTPSQGNLSVWQQRTTRSFVPANNKDSQHHHKAISVCDSRGPREALSLPATKTVSTITRQCQCVTAEDHLKHCPCQQQIQWTIQQSTVTQQMTYFISPTALMVQRCKKRRPVDSSPSLFQREVLFILLHGPRLCGLTWRWYKFLASKVISIWWHPKGRWYLPLTMSWDKIDEWCIGLFADHTPSSEAMSSRLPLMKRANSVWVCDLPSGISAVGLCWKGMFVSTGVVLPVNSWFSHDMKEAVTGQSLDSSPSSVMWHFQELIICGFLLNFISVPSPCSPYLSPISIINVACCGGHCHRHFHHHYCYC